MKEIKTLFFLKVFAKKFVMCIIIHLYFNLYLYAMHCSWHWRRMKKIYKSNFSLLFIGDADNICICAEKL